MDFVKEGKLEEEKKRRQAEWERVRNKETDPIEAPPDVFDNRTLYDKLKEQHDIKKKEFEDKFALKNQMRGIDDEEAFFLNEVDEQKLKRERERKLEERREVEEVKKALSSNCVEISSVPKINCTLPTHKKEKKQSDLLKSAVVLKRKISATSSATTLMNTLDSSFEKVIAIKKNGVEENGQSESDKDSDNEEANPKKTKTSNQIIVGILPGLGDYVTDSSSSDESSNDDDEEFEAKKKQD